MKKILFILSILMTHSTAWSYTPFPIDLNNLNPTELNNEHALLNQINKKLEELSDAHARLVAVRDQSLLNSEGIKDRSAQWLIDTNASVVSLNALLSILSSVNDLSDPVVRRSFQNQFHQLMSRNVKLSQEGLEIRKNIATAIGHVSSVRKFPINYLDGKAEFIQALNAYQEELLNALITIQSSISKAITEQLFVVSMSTRDVSNALVKKAALQYPELLAIVEDVNRMLLAETEITPRVTEVLDKNIEIKSFIQNNYIFTALDKVKELELRGEILKSEVYALNLPTELEQKAIADIDYQISDAQSFVSIYEPDSAVFVTRLYEEAKLLVIPCKDYPSVRKLYNCPLLGAVIGMDSSTISTLDEEMLRFIEKKIRQINAGPVGEIE